MIVADASCLVAALHGQEPSVRAVTTGQPVAAPHLVDAEVLSALRGLTIAGKLSAADAAPMITAWEALSLRRFPLTGLVRRMWELRHNLTSYDAAYVALAEGLGCALLTLDARLAGAPGIRVPVHVVPADPAPPCHPHLGSPGKK